jgi:hypothetical protein
MFRVTKMYNFFFCINFLILFSYVYSAEFGGGHTPEHQFVPKVGEKVPVSICSYECYLNSVTDDYVFEPGKLYYLKVPERFIREFIDSDDASCAVRVGPPPCNLIFPEEWADDPGVYIVVRCVSLSALIDRGFSIGAYRCYLEPGWAVFAYSEDFIVCNSRTSGHLGDLKLIRLLKVVPIDSFHRGLVKIPNF